MTEYNPPTATLEKFNSQVFRTTYTPLTLGDGDKYYRRILDNVYLTNSLTLNNSFRIGSNGNTTTTIYGIDTTTSSAANNTVSVGYKCLTNYIYSNIAYGATCLGSNVSFHPSSSSAGARFSCIGSNVYSSTGIGGNPADFTLFGANIMPIYSSSPSSLTHFGSSIFTSSISTNKGITAILGYNIYNSANGATTSRSLAIGSSCLNSVVTGNSPDCVTIGYNAGNTKTSGSNTVFIGSGAIGSTPTTSGGAEFVLGNSSINALRCATSTITLLSDRRDKKNIEPLDKGIEFVNQLKPVKFDWNMRDGGKVDIPQIGFIAQDLLEVGADVPNLVLTNNPDRLEVGYDILLPILIKAVQDLSAKVKIQQEILRMKLISKGIV
jgi:hypothetical protein